MKTKSKLCALLLFGAAAIASAQQTRIVGGTGTTLNQYPFMTALLEKGASVAGGQFCGSALVAPQWVLTAGHCMEGTPASSVEVWIGGRDLRNESEGIRVGVIQAIMHPNYGENSQGALVYDFCLLKLARAVTEKAPLPLVEAASQVAAGVTAKALGWGATSEGGSGSNVLLQVDLPIIALSVAGQTIPGLGATNLAAGRVSGGIDTCQGDSGGPLMVRNSAGAWAHAGTTSFGNGCARAGEYGIYGNTISVKPWIQSYIGGVTTPVDDYPNTTTNAPTLALNSSLTGNLETGGDVDVFKVMLTAAGTVTITSNGSTDAVGTLLSSTGATIGSDDNSAGSPNFKLTYTATAATTLFVKVSGKTTATTGGYGLSAAFSASTSIVPDIDVRAGTTVVPVNGSIDFGTRTVNSTALNRTITIANTGKAALALNGVSISGSGFSVVTQPAKSVAAAKTTSFVVAFKPTSAGAQSATLTISSNDPDENPFTINLTGTGQGAGDDHGNTFATATAISVPGTKTGVVNTGTDLDFFKFTLTSARTLTIKSTGSLDTWGTLYDANGNELDYADDSTDYNFVMVESLPAGTYYVSVEGYSTSDVGPYGLSIQ